jgi:tetratricopeptide (TPR) repeat protein
VAILVRSWLILFVSLLLLGSQPARGQEESASVYEEEGARLFLSKSYEGAIKQFTQAYRLDPKPQYLFNIGQSYRKLGLAAEAAEYYQRYLHDEQKIDPTIYADLTQYIDAEELIAQYVRDYRAGNQAVANEIMDQLKGVLQLRRDPILMYHIANGYDQVRRRRDALEYYRRFVAIETADPRLRRRSFERIAILTPAPPGQKYLWPSLALAIPGLAGVLTGVGLYVQSDSNFQLFQNESDEQKKRALRDKGTGLSIGSTAAYAAGGALLAGAGVFAIVALKKGIRQSSEDKGTEKKETQKRSTLTGALNPLPGGIGLSLGGNF